MASNSDDGAPNGSKTQRIQIEQHSFSGMLWFFGWLFAIGYLDLPFWRALLAVVLWPYYMGSQLGAPALGLP